MVIDLFLSVLIVGLVASVVFGVNYWRSLPADKRPAFARKATLYGSAALILLLVVTGRAPWLMGVLAALLAIMGRVAQFAAYIPVFKKVFGAEHSASANTPTPESMTKQQAAETLGVSATASPEEIRIAHKKLMQKMHPDRGGSEFLAKQINQAKDILLS